MRTLSDRERGILLLPPTAGSVTSWSWSNWPSRSSSWSRRSGRQRCWSGRCCGAFRTTTGAREGTTRAAPDPVAEAVPAPVADRIVPRPAHLADHASRPGGPSSRRPSPPTSNPFSRRAKRRAHPPPTAPVRWAARSPKASGALLHSAQSTSWPV